MQEFYIYKNIPCDNGDCPYNANKEGDCKRNCGTPVSNEELQAYLKTFFKNGDVK